MNTKDMEANTVKIVISGPQASGKTLMANLISCMLANEGVITRLEGERVTSTQGAEGLYTARRSVRTLLKGRAAVSIETTNETGRLSMNTDPEATADAERWARPSKPEVRGPALTQKIRTERIEGMIGNLKLPGSQYHRMAAEIFGVDLTGYLRLKVWGSHMERTTGYGAALITVSSSAFVSLPFRFQSKTVQAKLREI